MEIIIIGGAAVVLAIIYVSYNFCKFNKKFKDLDNKFTKTTSNLEYKTYDLGHKFTDLDRRFDGLGHKLTDLDRRFDGLDNKFTKTTSNLGYKTYDLGHKPTDLDRRFDSLDNKFTKSEEIRVLNLVLEHPKGIGNSDVARTLDMESSGKNGSHQNWDSWNILQQLVKEGKINQNPNDKKYYPNA